MSHVRLFKQHVFFLRFKRGGMPQFRNGAQCADVRLQLAKIPCRLVKGVDDGLAIGPVSR